MKPEFVDLIARARCRDAGENPEALVRVPAPGGAMDIPAWLTHRPAALALVSQMSVDLGGAGVEFVATAAGLAWASAVAGRG